MKLYEITQLHANKTTYREGPESTATHNSRDYQLDVLFKLTRDRQPIELDVDKLKWVLPYAKLHFDRLQKADVSVPILVYNDPEYGLTVIDGAHRLAKAVVCNLTYVPSFYVIRHGYATGSRSR